MASFRCSARNFRLTAPQTDMSKQEWFNHLKTLQPEYLCVSEEIHQDGNPHLHAAISFRNKKNIKKSNYFDMFGKKHVNILKADYFPGWITYIKKFDKEPLEEGEAPKDNKGKKSHILSEIDNEELFNYCVNNSIGFGYYQEEKRRRNNVSIDILEPTPGTMNLYLLSLIPDFSKTLVIIGTSGVGKTTWATTHATKPAILISHIDDLKLYKPDYHKSIIFDDMSFIQWPLQSQIHLVDRDQPRSIHVRYGVAKLPAGTEKIFTCNSFPFTEEEAILRRIKLIKV